MKIADYFIPKSRKTWEFKEEIERFRGYYHRTREGFILRNLKDEDAKTLKDLGLRLKKEKGTEAEYKEPFKRKTFTPYIDD